VSGLLSFNPFSCLLLACMPHHVDIAHPAALSALSTPRLHFILAKQLLPSHVPSSLTACTDVRVCLNLNPNCTAHSNMQMSPTRRWCGLSIDECCEGCYVNPACTGFVQQASSGWPNCNVNGTKSMCYLFSAYGDVKSSAGRQFGTAMFRCAAQPGTCHCVAMCARE
jgi:hypothetical protein